MRARTLRRRALTALVLVLAAAGQQAARAAVPPSRPPLTAVPVLGPPAAVPHPRPVDLAVRQAQVLRARVQDLQVQAEQATEDYDEASDALATAVRDHVSAQRELDRTAATTRAGQAQAGRRVRALYMAGGPSGLYASVLASADLGEAFGRLRQVGGVVDSDRRDGEAALRAQTARREAEQRLAATAERTVALQTEVADRVDRVQSLLATTSTLLASADARVRVLAEQQRRADEAAAQRRAAQALLRAAAQARAAAAARAAAVVRSRALLAAASAPQGGAGRSTAADGRAVPAPEALPTTPEALPTSPEALPTSPRAAAALAFAERALGTPYLWGATGPGAYDCSGLTGAAWAAAGVALPRTSRQQWYAGPHVALADLAPGDLLFWATDVGNPATIHHVALYLGGGTMIAAPHTGAFVQVQPLYLDGYIGAVRVGLGG